MRYLSNFAGGRPLLLDADHVSAVSELIMSDILETAEEKLEVSLGPSVYARVSDRPFYFSPGTGLAVIPVHGVLINRLSGMYGFATGYDFVRSAVMSASMDEDVKGIVFDIDSPGGMAAGNFELAEDIASVRGRKPMLAIVNSMAASGGYSIASAADQIVATPSAAVGSIGVVSTHMSFEKNLEQNGIEVTMIYAGKHKVDGNPYQNLPDEVRARMESRVAELYNDFVSLVARNRGLKPDQVAATEAEVFSAEDALGRGLIDAISSPVEAISSFVMGLSSQGKKQEQIMTDVISEGVEATVEAPIQIDQKARIKAIVSCEAAEGRRELAEHLAFNTDLNEEQAVAILEASPKAEKQNVGSSFESVMDSIEHPEVGADVEGDGEASKLTVAQQIIADYKAATGY